MCNEIIMSKFQVAVLKPSQIKYSETDMNYTRLSKERLLDDIEDYIQFITVGSKEELIEIIGQHLNIKQDEWGDTIKWYDGQYIYEICFNDDYFKKKDNINNIA